MMRNKYLYFVLVLLCILSVTSLGIAQEKQILRVSTWGGLYQWCYEEASKSFEEEYNVEIEWVLGETSHWNTMARMGQVDVVTSDLRNSLMGAKEGIYLPLDEGKVPNMANLYDMARENEYTVWTNVGDFVLAYNSKYVEEPPESWLEMWDDKYHQRVVMFDFADAGPLSLTVLLAEMAGGGIDNIQPGIDKMVELYKKGNIVAMAGSGDAEIQNLLQLEEAWLGMLGNGRVFDLQQKGADYVKIARPKEGTFGQISTIQIAKTTDKPDLAMAYVNHVLSAECMDIFTENTRYSPTVSNATIPEELEGVLLSGEDINNLYIVDWERVNEVREEWVEIWRRAIQ